jgi:chromosome segregation ATPase
MEVSRLERMAQGLEVAADQPTTEGFAAALRDDAAYLRSLESDVAELREKVRKLASERDRLDESETQLIAERDAAEDAVSDMYSAVMGEGPEWSNHFDFDDAVESVEVAISSLRAAKESAEQRAQALANDAARYRWLRDGSVHIDQTMSALFAVVDETSDGMPYAYGEVLRATDDLDAAIDAALASQPTSTDDSSGGST